MSPTPLPPPPPFDEGPLARIERGIHTMIWLSVVNWVLLLLVLLLLLEARR